MFTTAGPLLLGQIGEIGQARAPAPTADSGAASSSARTRLLDMDSVPRELEGIMRALMPAAPASRGADALLASLEGYRVADLHDGGGRRLAEHGDQLVRQRL